MSARKLARQRAEKVSNAFLEILTSPDGPSRLDTAHFRFVAQSFGSAKLIHEALAGTHSGDRPEMRKELLLGLICESAALLLDEGL
jgi:hypothetical protein